MSRKINAFDVPTDAEVADGTKLVPVADAATGRMYQATQAQVKAVMQTFKTKYTATGSEGTTLTVSAIAGKEVIAIYREGSVMYEVSSAPDELEFIWSTPTITLGLGVQRVGERFLILYKTL